MNDENSKNDLSRADRLVGALCFIISVAFWLLMFQSGDWSTAGMYLIFAFFVFGGFALILLELKIEQPIKLMTIEQFRKLRLFGTAVFVIAFVAAFLLGEPGLAYFLVVFTAPAFFGNWVRRPIGILGQK